MGVPKFYRWLSERYPLINQLISNGTMLPEIDNFYLDMNGIIHACSHPNDDSGTAVKISEREMMLAIFRYIDRCVSLIVKPKKLLFLAIDGCAPRAKLNQQRSRRFRAGQERQENMQKARQRGEIVDESSLFDSNCITPGTEFMERVDKHLRYYIHKKIKEDPIWRDLEVIYSGHDVPGEGEHKIIQWIRDERSKPGYEPNLRHCLYGQDADLIMLGLGTHEPHFTLLREVVDFSGGRRGMGTRETVKKQTQDAKFQLLHLSILREYIEVEFSHKHAGKQLDIERLIDDFVFMTFLVGNDFLPHLPTLDIGENGFDVIFDVYKELQNIEVGYLVKNGEISDLSRLEKLFRGIGIQESAILETREQEQKAFNAKRRKRNNGRGEPGLLSLEEEEEEEEELQRAMEEAIAEAASKQLMTQVNGGEMESKGSYVPSDDNNDGEWSEKKKRIVKHSPSENTSNPQEEVADEKSGGKDYRGRYYFAKFRMTPSNEREFLSALTEEYLKGLMWCLAYYTKGCISWSWYFPYYYGPMLADMTNLTAKKSRIEFELGSPFLPFQQLLGCLPPFSKELLPLPYQWLMISESSPLKDSYPVDFEIDMNGKRNPWEAVVLLPFIDSSALLEAESNHCPPSSLSPRERMRNSFGSILHYRFDPANNSTVPSCNADIGLADILNCQSSVTRKPYNLKPGVPFSPQLIPGTVRTCAGFPSLGVIPIKSVSFESIKLNIFGSESKYKSIIIHVLIRSFDEKTIDMKVLLNRSIFVNYPLLHEAKVVGVSTEDKSFVVKKRKRQGEEEVIEERIHDQFAKTQWRKESSSEEAKYLKGRGIPGTGGINVEEIKMRLQVVPLQGMQVDRETGSRTKVFGNDVIDVPIQMALWTSPVVDKRFEERAEQSVQSMFPFDTEVIATSGPFLGRKGRVIGPHKPQEQGTREGLNKTKPAEKDGKPRTVDVEFIIHPPEPPFGYALNVSISDEYLSSREVCKLLNLTPSLLGMVAGSLPVMEPRGGDLGLNLKKNNEYQLLGYCRQYSGGKRKAKGPTKPLLSAWGSGDTVQIIGSAVERAEEEPQVDSGMQWEYSDKAVQLISDYMQAFPIIFNNLRRLPSQRRYSLQEVFGTSGGEDDGYSEGLALLEKVVLWMKQQPFFQQPRSPLTTLCMSREAIRAVERAADVLVSNLQQPENCKKVIRKGVPVASLFRGDDTSPYDCPLVLDGQDTGAAGNASQATAALPELGDRVINLVASGVPFGLRGTVIGVHSSSGYVEVLFDEEFGNGKSLQGLCSQFRGALVPWQSVLRVSTNTLSAPSSAPSASVATVAPSSSASSRTKVSKEESSSAKSAKSKPKQNKQLEQESAKKKTPSSASPAQTSTGAKTDAAKKSDDKSKPKGTINITGILRRDLQKKDDKQSDPVEKTTGSGEKGDSEGQKSAPMQKEISNAPAEKRRESSSSSSSPSDSEDITASMKKASISSPNTHDQPSTTAQDDIKTKLLKAKAKMRANMDEKTVKPTVEQPEKVPANTPPETRPSPTSSETSNGKSSEVSSASSASSSKPARKLMVPSRVLLSKKK